MPSDSFAWLHLTDFHYGLRGQKHLWPNLRQPFLDDLKQVHDRCGPWQAVLFTGDFVQQGKSDEFRDMQREVLNRLWDRLRLLGSGDAVLLGVPGNHDLYRPDAAGDNPAVDMLLEKDGFARVADKFWDKPASPYRRVVTDAFAAYSQWWRSAPQRPKNLTVGALPGDFACTLEHGGRRVGVVGLNTTFLQLQGGDYQGRLVWDARQLHAACGGAADDWLSRHDVCLLLTHQGPEWLTPDARQHGETEIAPAGRFAAHLFGHTHETDIVYVRKGGNPNATRLCQGCSVFGMEMYGEPPTTLVRRHGYAAGRIEFGTNDATLRLWPRVATKKTGPWRFIPDYDHSHLEPDQGTPPETIPLRFPTAPWFIGDPLTFGTGGAEVVLMASRNPPPPSSWTLTVEGHASQECTQTLTVMPNLPPGPLMFRAEEILTPAAVAAGARQRRVERTAVIVAGEFITVELDLDA